SNHHSRSGLAAIALLLFALSAFIRASAAAQVELTIDSSKPGEHIDLTRYALGQGGLSEKPMFDPQVEQVAQLHPQTIRFFLQEYFEPHPKRAHYHWTTLDKVAETILATGAKPLFCICFKPKVLYPKVDQQIVHPTDYKE